MSDISDYPSEEEQRLFRPFTRESLAAIEQRIAQENEKLKELEKKRADGEVGNNVTYNLKNFFIDSKQFFLL